jgi:hypothetical protein
MEDWLYASGWDRSLVKKCSGLKEDQQAQNNRAIVFLVETSDQKAPHQPSLGTTTNVILKKKAFFLKFY